MNMQKLFAILFGLSIAVSPFATAMVQKEEIPKDISFDLKKMWNDGGIAEKSLMVGIPSFLVWAVSSAVCPNATKFIWNFAAKPAIAYLAYKSVFAPKEKETSWDKEIKKDAKNIIHNLWTWTKGIFEEEKEEEPYQLANSNTEK
jgi:hypothetical protein